MIRPIHSPFSFFFFFFDSIPITLAIAFIPRIVQAVTLESDVEALRSLKSAIDNYSIPDSSFLRTWNFDVDPCQSPAGQFLGILCTDPLDNSTERVIVVELDEVGYDGFLSPAIGNLTELTILNLSRNKFSGPIPVTISKLQKLIRLSLSENVFTGNLPPRIKRLRRLEIMDISHNELSGSIPRMISEFKSLTQLKLSNNRFSGRIPDLTGLWQLNALDLSSNSLSGNLPPLPVKLTTLSLKHNALSGHISPLIGLKQLERLDLSDNKLSGSIRTEILTLPELNLINVSTNTFSIMDVIKNSRRATKLQVLDVHGNRLHGHLPINLVTYGNVTAINLANNQFSGPIPKEYWQQVAEAWTSLFLDHNFLVGNLTAQFRNGAEERIRGSLAQNCLDCPHNIHLCSGGQRPASQCFRRNGTYNG